MHDYAKFFQGRCDPENVVYISLFALMSSLFWPSILSRLMEIKFLTWECFV